MQGERAVRKRAKGRRKVMEGEREAKKTRVRVDITKGGPGRVVGILVISVAALSACFCLCLIFQWLSSINLLCTGGSEYRQFF